jgi:hypothetical protein
MLDIGDADAALWHGRAALVELHPTSRRRANFETVQ